MGQEILYCFKCQTRLLGSDFEKGKAFRVDSQAACPDCVRDLLAHLPNPDAELERLKKAQVPKPSSGTSSSTKMQAIRLDSTARLQATPRSPEPPASSSRTPMLIAAGVGGLVLVIGLAVAFSRSKEPQTSIVVTPDPPRPDPTPRPVPRPDPTSPVARDLEELDARVALPLRQDKFQEAAGILAAARGKRSDVEWAQGIEDRVRKVELGAKRVAAPLLEQAAAAARSGDQAALKDLRTRIEAFAMPALIRDLESAIAAVKSDPWIVLDLQSLVSEEGATMTKQADGSVLVGGKKALTDTYTASAQIGLRQVRAFRLEAMANPALPSGGPGRAKNGNFVLAEFKALSGGAPLAFSGASSSHEQDRYPSSAAVDGNPQTGWAILYKAGQTSVATFHLQAPADLDSVTFVLESRTPHPEHNLGCFRISATAAELPAPPPPRAAYEPSPVVVPDKPEVPPAVAAYRAKWAAAAKLAAARDLAGAAKSLEETRAGLTDDALRKEADADLADFKLAADALAEVPRLLTRWTKGVKIALEFVADGSSVERLEGTVLDSSARGVSLQIDGGPYDVPAGELASGSIAALLALRGEKKPADARAVAVLAALEGGASADVPARFAEVRGSLDPKEADARRLFWSAEDDFASMKTRGAAAGVYEKLLQEPTLFSARNKAFIDDRIAAARDVFLFADELVAGGTFSLSSSPKLESYWLSSADSAPGKAAANFLEADVFVAPGGTCRAWVYAGGCCQEVFTFYLQGTGLSGPSAKNPKETVTTTPGGEDWIIVKSTAISLKKKHADHTGPKEPDRWMWIELGALKFAEPGSKKLRLLTEQKGFAVAYLAAGSTRQAPPRETEVKDLLKSRPPVVFAPSGSILREVWRSLSGETIADLTGAAKFKEGKPDDSGLIPTMDSTGLGTEYGSRMRGYVHPPETGEYVFWIATDDYGELWLSTDESPARKQKICSLNHAVGHREWTKEAKSAPIPLVAGKRYYIELLHKQGGGPEHAAVGWTLPGGAQERPIPGSRLSSPSASPVHRSQRPRFFRTLLPNAPVARSAYVGGEGGKEFEHAPNPRQFLRGIKYSVSSSGALNGLKPVFQGPSGDVDGANAGGFNSTKAVVGRPGYVVGGALARGTNRLNAIKLIFVRMSGNRLIMSDRYESDWIGTRAGGAEVRLGDDGTPVVGIFGKSGGEIDGGGLLLQGK